MPPKTKRQSDEGSASGDEDLSESLPDEDNAFDNEIDSSFRKGGGAKEMKRRAMGEDEDPTIGKEKFESMKPDYMSQVRINTKKGTDVYLDEDEEERVSEHNRDTLFKVYFDEMVERVQKDLGGPLVLNDVDFSNMDVGPRELKIFTTAILEHFKVTGKPCFVHYMNFSVTLT